MRSSACTFHEIRGVDRCQGRVTESASHANLERSLALVLHELTINALSNWALAKRDCREAIDWTRDADVLSITWC
jgi:hypothetical protein